ncbi:coatomer subunit zeta-2 isoform X5 [Cuculus canorus]|uniref:coatomer subunit zeta-2 isoform X5 n=1 Tax=Cuculus canorus TaxID=55661 RepID=UPI0023AB06F5|nr:coatomer subunit zeta-2 isoform X5 [Cuculus canorus]
MELTGPEPSLYTVKALLILDSHGQRLLAKYYDSTFPTAKARAAFERSIFRQSQRTGGEIACLEGLTIVYRRSVDLFFYVVGGCQENELMLLAVLTCLLDALGHLLRGLRSRTPNRDQEWVQRHLPPTHPQEGGGEALAAGQHGGDVPGGG